MFTGRCKTQRSPAVAGEGGQANLAVGILLVEITHISPATIVDTRLIAHVEDAVALAQDGRIILSRYRRDG